MLSFEEGLSLLASANVRGELAHIGRGIEKEGLRVSADGHLSAQPHPLALGSALTHPMITTDFSESLMEFITGVHQSPQATLSELQDIQQFCAREIAEEYIWASSMPCAIPDSAAIPIARYGTSHLAQMKHNYRCGLSYRYGSMMQCITGIHYNFSFSDSFWEHYQLLLGDSLPRQQFITQHYFNLIRNFHRWVWLITYLFGASPVVDASFLRARQHNLHPIGRDTYGLPEATALRLGRLGYRSQHQNDFYVSTNCLSEYIDSLHNAILTPFAPYKDIPVGRNGQLNDGLLQIENEFYSTIRPKQIAHPSEPSLCALQRRGIAYVELRCVDINPYRPFGIDAEQIYFMDAFLCYCLLAPSSYSTIDDERINFNNLEHTVHYGRKPHLLLQRNDQSITLPEWGEILLGEVMAVAECLDGAIGGTAHRDSCRAQCKKIAHAAQTPSARIVEQASTSSYVELITDISQGYAQTQSTRTAHNEAIATLSRQSLRDQHALEIADTLSYEEYVRAYYDQYHCCRS